MDISRSSNVRRRTRLRKQNYEFHFEFVKLDVLVNYLGRKIQQAAGNMHLNLGRQVDP